MALCYTDILNPNADFQRAVNLSLDQGNLMLVEKYIPTVASATLIARYLKAVLHPGNDRASILIGPYGKGKSHTLFVIFQYCQNLEMKQTRFSLALRIEWKLSIRRRQI